MPAKRVTMVTVPVDGRSGVVFESYPGRTPLLTIIATRPALLVTVEHPGFDAHPVSWLAAGLSGGLLG